MSTARTIRTAPTTRTTRKALVIGGGIAGTFMTAPNGLVALAAVGLEAARCLAGQPDLASALAAYEGARRPAVEEVAAGAAVVNGRKASAGV
ncbi:hypothetical protein ACIQOW_29610 [Kitasatospora sp. NPDC091335]|uniref:hypothetical protein n=1 Tax=Kitasatospora sp. NPDC091335 TaxID=3364085 RepID=UPI0038207DEB